MSQKRAAQGMRLAGCAALLALLVASSYAAVRPTQVPSVPVTAMTMSGEALSGASMAQTRQSLSQKRDQALALLQSVLDDPRAKDAQIAAALEGRITMDEAVSLVKQLSRNYAKKQMTWFQRDPRTVWIEAMGKSAGQITDEMIKYMEKQQ